MKDSFSYLIKNMRKETRGQSWKLAYSDFRPAKEGLRESLCTVGNGYFGTRGAVAEATASRIHYPGTYIAGVYDKLSTNIAGKTVTNEDFVNCPNWLYLTFKTGKGRWVVPSQCQILYYYQELDMYKGILARTVRLRNKAGFTFTIYTQRLAHMENPHLGCIRYVITPEDYEGPLIIRSGLDGTVENKGVARYRRLQSKHLKPHSIGKIKNNIIHLSTETSQSGIIISQTAKTRIFFQDKELHPENSIIIREKKAIYQDFHLRVQPQEEYEIEKTVSMYTSKDKYVSNPRAASIKSAESSCRFGRLVWSHKKAWSSLWKKFDIDIEGETTFRKLLRLHAFHLLQSASFHNTKIDAGLPARGLHGESYRGHIFWDQLFAMPFYNLRAPDISRALLMYRYRRLARARKNAEEEGFKGAIYPWQSGADGDEQSQSLHLNPMSGRWGPDHSRIQRHISFDVAYNIWCYWQQTGDMDFLVKYGAEMLLSIAQFGSSLSRFKAADGRYHTEGVMGPDEFHDRFPGASEPGFKDNAYTNVMIVATLLRALSVLELVPQKVKTKLLKRLSIDQGELARWEDITRRMNIIINKSGIISQFAGYFGLKELNWEKYKKKYGNIHRMDRILKAEGKSANDYKVAKQADVLMIFYVFSLREVKDMFRRLGYYFDRQTLKKNYEYYRHRTSHGSTLSKVVHCYLAHLLNKPIETWRMYLDVLKSDIYDTQGGTTPEGVHTGVMGGSIDIAIRCFAGVEISEDSVKLNPRLPQNWRSIKLRFLYKGAWVLLRITLKQIDIFIPYSRAGRNSVPVEIYGKRHMLSAGELHKIELKRPSAMEAKEGVEMIGQERVLIVDSDIMQGMMLKTRFEELGYLADYSYRGSEALELLKAGWIDLIIMAVPLEGAMSGRQLFKEIRLKKEYADIPIIVQSKKSGVKRVFEKMGAAGFFARPYSVDALIEKAQKVMNSRE